MPRPTRGMLYVARTAGLTAGLVGLAFLAHAAGGGGLPSAPALLVLSAVAGWACAWIARYRLPRSAVLAVLAVGQVLLHHGLTYFAASACLPARGGAVAPLSGHGGHGSADAVGAACSVPAETAAIGALSQGHAGSSGPLLMLLAHALATVLLALVLARGERAVWAVAGWLSPLLTALLILVPDSPAPIGRRLAPRAFGAPWRPAREGLLGVSPRRGPPRRPYLVDVAAA